MRITGGEYRGRSIEPPQGWHIRPTSDKVRQAIFNILNARGGVRDTVVLDGFCGTGALGLEAISWGALCCTFIDNNRSSLDLCRANYAALKMTAKSSFVLADCTRPGPKRAESDAADLVFLDPPYAQDLIVPALEALEQNGYLSHTATVLIECEKQFDPQALSLLGYEVVLTRDYGDTRIALAQK